jgi:predicted glycoside hydrolase/deacetylase ChbG (UPF0249 family)
MRRLIVNADDFGQTAGINDGILHCHAHGIVSSTSLMVRWPYAHAAAERARTTPALSVGLHLDLGEWVYADGAWSALYDVVPLDDAAAVQSEILDQLDAFRRVMCRDPTHIDSHQHVHCRPGIKAFVVELGERLGIPVRHCGQEITHLGEFYGQDRKGRIYHECITAAHLIDLLTKLPEGSTTELSCHPGTRSDAHGMYVAQREQEILALCDPFVRAFMQSACIDLVSFHDVVAIV